jgi:hypothetical protein
MDAATAAVCRESDAPVVSARRDHTHLETRKVVDIGDYR